jgi:hypothetical protein
MRPRARPVKGRRGRSPPFPAFCHRRAPSPMKWEGPAGYGEGEDAAAESDAGDIVSSR